MVYKTGIAAYNYIPFALVIVRETDYTVAVTVKKELTVIPQN